MARACASGILYHCTCSSKPEENSSGDFQWGGCGDNLRWGVYFAKRFIDNVEKNNVNKTRKRRDDFSGNDTTSRTFLPKRDVAAINLHNNRVGRRVSFTLGVFIPILSSFPPDNQRKFANPMQMSWRFRILQH